MDIDKPYGLITLFCKQLIMIKKGTKLYSILKFKCPYCHEGDFFQNPNPYQLKTCGQINETCPSCNKKFSLETGFYYGAMYVSYGLGVGTFLGIFALIYLIYPEGSYEFFIGVIIASILLSGPLLYALSRIIWANMFMKYNGKTVPK